jgi:hypothetical protein
MRSKAVLAAAIGLLLAAASAQPEPRRHEDGSIHYYGAVGVPQGDDVPASGTGIFRATRYAPDFAGFAGRDMTPGFPIERYQTPALATLEPDARARPGAPRCSVWPSPFSAVTTVRFQLSEAQTVRLVVFDQSGRAVRVLASAWFDAGTHDAVWDGRAERGAELPTGVYFCRLQAEADQSTIRVALVRP